MNPVLVVARHDFKRLFVTPLPWVILACVQFLVALFFYRLLSAYMESPALYSARGISEIVIAGMLQIAGLLMLLVSPFITMRTFSEELRSGTIRLLLSSPLSISAIVVGKFLAVMGFFLLLSGLIALLPLSISTGTRLDAGLIFSGFLGLLLLFSLFTATGLFFSSLSQSPALAAISTFLFSFLIWIGHIANDSDNEHVEMFANYISSQKHFNAMLSGAFNSADPAYFLLGTCVFLALCIWRLDRIRTHP